MTTAINDSPVHKTITVHASPELAFRVFTDELDSWWPRTHHIGKTPMTRTRIEARVGGRCYSEHADGSESQWGSVLVWNPPRRLVFAWQIDGKWQHQPDLAKSSEVEVRFTLQPDGSTRVDLEHRHFDRMGETDAVTMRTAVESGWAGLLQRFYEHIAQAG